MTILSIVKDVCAVVGVRQPASVFSNPSDQRTAFEMSALANEMAQRIAYDAREWVSLLKNHVFVGNGTASYLLPADFKRMTKTANVWRSTTPLRPMVFTSNTDEWLRRRLADVTDPRGEWMMGGSGDIAFWPPLAAAIPADPAATPPILAVPAVTAIFTYLSKNCVALTGGGAGDQFMNDGDSFILDERLLKLGMIWQWKANKGSPYAEDMATYMDALSTVMGADKPSPTLIDRLPISAAARTSYPFPTPTSADWQWSLR